MAVLSAKAKKADASFASAPVCRLSRRERHGYEGRVIAALYQQQH
jgi:hypothetical protein